MNFVLWILSVLAGGTLAGVLLAALGWLAKNWLLTRLKAAVQHEFDQKLERLRSDLRRGEDALRDVRTTALTALAAKETARDTRRIEGIEAVWKATLELRKHSGPAATFAVLNYEEVCRRIEAVPDQAHLFKPFRPDLISTALEYLELRLLVAIREDSSGTEPTMATLQQAKRIAEAADSVSADIAAASPSAPTPPPLP